MTCLVTIIIKVIFVTHPITQFIFFPCNESETKTYIDSLKSNAAGYDDLIAFIMKQSSNDISLPLTHIINLSFRHGVLPDRI